MSKAPKCVFCGEPCEEWPGGHGYGNNPEPLASFPERCCGKCNSERVIPARLAEMSFGKAVGRDV
jgi:hypothetical protein